MGREGTHENLVGVRLERVREPAFDNVQSRKETSQRIRKGRRGRENKKERIGRARFISGLTHEGLGGERKGEKRVRKRTPCWRVRRHSQCRAFRTCQEKNPTSNISKDVSSKCSFAQKAEGALAEMEFSEQRGLVMTHPRTGTAYPQEVFTTFSARP